MDALMTPEVCFRDLPDFPFQPRTLQVEPHGLTMAYLDEGPRDAPVALLLHGEPSWSFLYRHMIGPLMVQGLRVVAPDLIGFGRSAKPTRQRDYTYARHVAWLASLLAQLDLRRVTLFGQDWGSLTGLRLAAEHEERFAAIVIGNGYLPDGTPPKLRAKELAGVAPFLVWRSFARVAPQLPIGRIVNYGSGGRLTPKEIAAYDAPFPNVRYQAGAKAFPALVPLTPRDPAAEANRAAWRVLERWEKPFVTAFSSGDPITRGLDRRLQRRIPGAEGQPHVTLKGGHFLQERSGPELAKVVADATRRAGA
ncbi:MAG: haloalkane dehalogenase [Myxococcota bacterium]